MRNFEDEEYIVSKKFESIHKQVSDSDSPTGLDSKRPISYKVKLQTYAVTRDSFKLFKFLSDA